MTSASGRLRRYRELIRFYQAALINTAFGFGTYVLLVWLGLDRYVAQALATVLGIAFNYLSYSRHVFRDRKASIGRFLGAYLLNYLVNLALLKLYSQLLPASMFASAASALDGYGLHFGPAQMSALVAGFGASLSASLINYFALKHLVFATGGA